MKLKNLFKSNKERQMDSLFKKIMTEIDPEKIEAYSKAYGDLAKSMSSKEQIFCDVLKTLAILTGTGISAWAAIKQVDMVMTRERDPEEPVLLTSKALQAQRRVDVTRF